MKTLFAIVVLATLATTAQAQSLDQQINAVNAAAIEQQTAEQINAAAQAQADAMAQAKAEARADRQEARAEAHADLDLEEHRARVQYSKGVVRRENDIIDSQIRRNDAEGRKSTTVILY